MIFLFSADHLIPGGRWGAVDFIKMCPRRRAKPPRAARACRIVDRHRLLPRPFSLSLPRASARLARASPPPDEAAKRSTIRRLVSPRPCLQQRKTIGTRLTPTTRVRGSREGWESGFQPCDFFHYGVRQCGHAGLKRPHLLRPSSFVPRTCFVWQAAAGRAAQWRDLTHTKCEVLQLAHCGR